MGGRSSKSGMGSGKGKGKGKGNTSVTPTSIPSLTVDNIQRFVDQFSTGLSVQQMVEKVYDALPTIKTFIDTTGKGMVGNKGASILDDKYLMIDNGPGLQFIRQKSKGTWKVKTF